MFTHLENTGTMPKNHKISYSTVKQHIAEDGTLLSKWIYTLMLSLPDWEAGEV